MSGRHDESVLCVGVCAILLMTLGLFVGVAASKYRTVECKDCAKASDAKTRMAHNLDMTVLWQIDMTVQ